MEVAGFEGKLRAVLQEVAFELNATDGEQFLHACVEHLVQTFGMAYGFVGRLYHNDAGIPSIRVLVAMAHGKHIDPFHYTLPGTRRAPWWPGMGQGELRQGACFFFSLPAGSV